METIAITLGTLLVVFGGIAVLGIIAGIVASIWSR